MVFICWGPRFREVGKDDFRRIFHAIPSGYGFTMWVSVPALYVLSDQFHGYTKMLVDDHISYPGNFPPSHIGILLPEVIRDFFYSFTNYLDPSYHSSLFFRALFVM